MKKINKKKFRPQFEDPKSLSTGAEITENSFNLNFNSIIVRGQ